MLGLHVYAAAAMPIQDLPLTDALLQLLERCALPTADLHGNGRVQFRGILRGALPVASIGLERCGDDGLLRSLAVAPEHRGEGHAGLLVADLEQLARRQGLQQLYLLTTTAENFFLRRGYQQLPRAQAPQSIRHSAEFSALCPQSAVLMVKVLAE